MMENHVKTFILLACLTALLLFVGSLFGQGGFYLAVFIVVIMNLISYFYSHKIVLLIYKAKEVTKNQEPRLHRLVEEVCKDASIPKPKVYLVPSDSPNAFATGRNPANAVIACTRGIMHLLNDNELKAVIAHEASHIRNRDILIQTVAATIAGVISYVAFMAKWGALFGGFGGRDSEGGANMIGLLALAIITPIVALIIQLAISRAREFLADSTAAKITKQPGYLADALEKLHKGIKHNPLRFGNNSTSSLFIANPFNARGFVALLSTHPPIQMRVKKLREMK